METFNYTTTCKTILADLYTPVGVYMRLRDIYPQSALMESSDYHDKDNSRSFIGINPIASVAIGHGEATINFRMAAMSNTLSTPTTARQMPFMRSPTESM